MITFTFLLSKIMMCVVICKFEMGKQKCSRWGLSFTVEKRFIASTITLIFEAKNIYTFYLISHLIRFCKWLIHTYSSIQNVTICSDTKGDCVLSSIAWRCLAPSLRLYGYDLYVNQQNQRWKQWENLPFTKIISK